MCFEDVKLNERSDSLHSISFILMLTEHTSMTLDRAEVRYELGLVEKHQKTLGNDDTLNLSGRFSFVSSYHSTSLLPLME